VPTLSVSLRSVPNRIAVGITLAAALIVLLWSMRPMTGSWEYRASAGGTSLRHPVTFEGFAEPEPWGRWTTGEKATLTFGRALPARFVAVVRAHAFGPNVGAPVRVCAGASCNTAAFEQSDTEVRLAFRAHGGSRRLTFHIPHPTAPGNDDAQTFGVGLVAVRIEEAR
jgi:hypothetical protein